MDKTYFKKYLKQLHPLPTGQTLHGSLVPPIQALLFDLYGTLFISGSGDIHSLARPNNPPGLQDLLEAYSLSDSPQALLHRMRDHIQQAHQKARSQGICFPEVQIEQIWRTLLPFDEPEAIRRFAVAFELIINPVWPMPNALKLIQACQSAGLVLGIISNAQFFTPYLFQWFFRQSTDQLGFHPELTIFSYQCGRAKPSPELFQKARLQLEKMGIAAGRVVFIGNDMRNDILPARNTGFQTVLFAGDARSLRLHEEDPVCSRAQADLVVTDLEHLLSYLSTP